MKLPLTGFALALSCISTAAGLLVGQDPSLPAAPKTPAELEKARIEREIQGIWEVRACENPSVSLVIRSSGYMLVHDGWLSIQVVITHRDKSAGGDVYSFLGSMKRYTVTDLNRLRLEDVWGFSNPSGDLKPDVRGTIEERVMLFSGPYEVGQTLRITRGAGNWLEFVRRAKPVKPAAAVTPTEK